MFRRNVEPPCSGSRSKPRQHNNLPCLVLVCSIYSEDVSSTHLRNVGGPEQTDCADEDRQQVAALFLGFDTCREKQEIANMW
jgi:hypothetical protein